MNTITLRIDYSGTIKLNNEYTTTAPITMTWFPGVDLIIETDHEKRTFNGTEDAVISFSAPSRELDPVDGVQLKLAKNSVAHYLIINGKYAVKLPDLQKYL